MASDGGERAISWEWVVPGAAAHHRLGEVVDELKAGDPLVAVSVVVPANPAGVWARRAMGARRAGVVGVAFGTLAELAAELAADRLDAEQSVPLADQELLALVRGELERTDGAFHSVRHHASTQRVVADAIAAFRRVPDLTAELDGPDRAGRSLRSLARQVLAIGERISSRAGFHDDVDELVIAAEEVTGGRAPALGSVVVFLPEWFGAHERALLVALAGAGVEVRVLAALTGDRRADGVIMSLAEKLGVVPPSPPGDTPAVDAEVIEAADPETEVRHAVAWLVDRHRNGVPWDELALGYTATVPYARLVEHILDEAGVPWNGPSTTTLASTSVGRLVAAMLRLIDGDLARRDVIAALGCLAPPRREWPLSSWDRLSRRAGVVGGIEQWRERLDGEVVAALADADIDGIPEDDRGRHRARAERARALRYLVDQLAMMVEPLRDPGSWSAAVDTVRGWLSELEPSLLRSPDEQKAVAALGTALLRLAGLDALEPEPRTASIREALSAELDRRVGRHGRIGLGLLAGPLPALAGAAPRAVALVGLSEGLAPRRLRPGAVLGNAECAGREADLGLDTELLQLRRFRCVVGAASDAVLLLAPAVDPRSARRLTPSRWLSDDRTGTGVDRTDRTIVPSLWADAARRTPLTRAELTHAALARRSADPRALSAWLAADHLESAREILAGRRRGLSVWSGLVGPHDALDTTGKVHSITAFEQYAKCPTKYLYGHVLGVRREDEPEAVEGLDPRSRGELVHLILQRWLEERIDRDGELHLEILEQVMNAEFDAWEETRAVGSVEVWHRDRQDVAVRLSGLVELEEGSGAEWMPHAAEMEFGENDSLRVETPGGAIRFKGRIDRVDRRADGALRVVDYKVRGSGKNRSSVDVVGVRRGEALQLPLYGRAAAASVGGAMVRAEYWESASGQARAFGVDLGDVDDAFTAAVGDIAEAIGAGVFPLQPGEETPWPRSSFANCRYCEFDSVCPSQRAEHAEAAAVDPAAEPVTRRFAAAVGPVRES